MLKKYFSQIYTLNVVSIFSCSLLFCNIFLLLITIHFFGRRLSFVVFRLVLQRKKKLLQCIFYVKLGPLKLKQSICCIFFLFLLNSLTTYMKIGKDENNREKRTKKECFRTLLTVFCSPFFFLLVVLSFILFFVFYSICTFL